jgi:hypothetical protein
VWDDSDRSLVAGMLTCDFEGRRLNGVRFSVVVALLIAVLSSAAGTASASREATPTAQAVVLKLRKAGLPIGAIKVYSGRPGQTTGKVNFRDKRIKDDVYAPGFSVYAGGSVEVFASEADAQRRANYVERFGERDYVEGKVLLRLTHWLEPHEAKEYEVAFRRLV